MYFCRNLNIMGKRIIITGASSGMGKEVAKIFISKGYIVGLAARRLEKLQELQELDKDNVFVEQIDVTKEDAGDKLQQLIDRIGGLDIYFNASGVGWENKELAIDKEITTINTNALGFARMIVTTFNYFAKKGFGQIAVISSIAGVKGMGAAPSYSATKRFENHYIDALEQLAHIRKLDIKFTDIRPGFVATDLLDNDKNYPILMDKTFVANEIAKAIEKNTRCKIIDWRYRILVFFWKLLPSCLWKRMNVSHK